MKRFLILKNTFDDKTVLMNIFKALVGNRLELKEEQSYLIFYFSYDNQEDIQTLFLSLGSELMVDIIGYISSFEDNRLEEEFQIAIELMESLPNGIFSLKSALLSAKQIKNKNRILDFVLESSGIDEDFIKKFAENNLNVSQASKTMFIHRNTINYKLDKLKELSGFDLRVFLDAYILYKLVIGK